METTFLTRHGIALVALAVGAALGTTAQGQKLAYPEARRVHQVDTYYGVEVADPYRWMEDLTSTEVQAWMVAQDELRAAFLEERALVESIQRRMVDLGRVATRSTPTRRGGHTFFYQKEIEQTQSNLYVQEGEDGALRLLMDFEALTRDGTTVFVSTYSPDGAFLTYNTAANQSRWSELHILPVAEGQPLPETLRGIYGGGSIAWTKDGRGFFYVRYPVPDDPQAPLGRARIYYHRAGTAQDQDEVFYERPDEPILSYGLRVSREGRYLIISASGTGGSFNGMSERLFYADLQDPMGGVRELFEGVDATFAFEGNQGPRFVVRTSHEAPRARLLAVDISQPEAVAWKEILPEAEEVIMRVSEVGDRLVAQYLKDARIVVRVFDFTGAFQYELDDSAPAFWGPIWNDNPESDITYYGLSNLYDSNASYRLNVRTGETSLYDRPESRLNPDDFTLKQVFYESKDGTRVPMFLVHRSDLELDGSNPVFMYAYGAWAWSAFPWQRHMLPWIEMGGVYAVPNIRGGGEYGEAWHEAGMRRNKQNGIDDYIAAAEWLIENRYTSPARMIANGGSASGMLPAVAVNQRPDLFGASVINFPTLDQLRFPHFGSAKSWVAEYGDPNDPDDFKALYAYSPYHNLKEGVCYPPTWIQVGEKDEATTPMHGYKFAAALQAAQGCDNPVLLKIAWGAGHSYGLTAEQARETQAEELAFLAKVLGMEIPPAYRVTGSN